MVRFGVGCRTGRRGGCYQRGLTSGAFSHPASWPMYAASCCRVRVVVDAGNEAVDRDTAPLAATSLRLLCNKDRNPPGGALLVFRVRRVRRNGKLPEPRPFILVLDLAH